MARGSIETKALIWWNNLTTTDKDMYLEEYKIGLSKLRLEVPTGIIVRIYEGEEEEN
jgi:hypothetical protein